jgi:hypothetical protein
LFLIGLQGNRHVRVSSKRDVPPPYSAPVPGSIQCHNSVPMAVVLP